MRLLNVKSLKFTEFPESEVPRYIIASHRWETTTEAIYYDVRDRTNTERDGYKKIEHFCDFIKTRLNNVKWLWIDTCCIDKSSSSEVHEAVNSMFKWYERSYLCLAYLGDVDGDKARPSGLRAEESKNLKNSVWFRRGWTLQELLAPQVVVMVSKTWQVLGHKGKFPNGNDSGLDVGPSLERHLSLTTEVPENVLKGKRSLATIDVHVKMDWMQLRQTTRSEDMAYCLLGLFQVHLALIYGEGEEEARTRLFEAIEVKEKRNRITGLQNRLRGAVEAGSVHDVTVQLESGAAIDKADAKGWRPIHLAGYWGHVEIIKLLIEKGANERLAVHGQTVLHLAAGEGRVDAVRFLLDRRAHDKAADDPVKLVEALRYACAGGHTEVAELLLQYGAHVNGQSGDGRTALWDAINGFHWALAAFLLRRGASLSIRDNDGYTNLTRAAGTGQIAIARFIIENGGEINKPTGHGRTALHIAASYGKYDMVLALVDEGADINTTDNKQWTPINSAASHGFASIVRLLLDLGADSSIATEGGWYPLTYSAARNHLEIVRLLLVKGADVTQRNLEGRTALSIACAYSFTEVAKLLIEHGANTKDVTGDNGWTLLHEACFNDNFEIAKLLLENEAHSSASTTDDHTPLHYACHVGNVLIVELLLKHNAIIHIRTKNGHTPFSIARAKNHKAIEALLGNELVRLTGKPLTPMLPYSYRNIGPLNETPTTIFHPRPQANHGPISEILQSGYQPSMQPSQTKSSRETVMEAGKSAPARFPEGPIGPIHRLNNTPAYYPSPKQPLADTPTYSPSPKPPPLNLFPAPKESIPDRRAIPAPRNWIPPQQEKPQKESLALRIPRLLRREKKSSKPAPEPERYGQDEYEGVRRKKVERPIKDDPDRSLPPQMRQSLPPQMRQYKVTASEGN